MQLIYPSGDPSGFDEVIYSMGGGEGDQNLCSDTITNEVQKVINPAPHPDPVAPNYCTAWDDSVPDLNYPRVYASALVLLDGSILVVGGYRWDPLAVSPIDGSLGWCVPVLETELYRPPEIFGAGWGGSWKIRQAQLHPRTYHGSAVQLSSGVVVSAGSVGTDHCFKVPQPAWHSVEVYYPPYFFDEEPRPTITSVNGFSDPSLVPTIVPGSSIDIEATLFTDDSGQFRVALVAPGSTTHGVDFNQRYVVIPHDPQSFSQNGADASFSVTLPPHAPALRGILPQGWYMLTVVNANGLPSGAWWIRVLL